MVLANSFESTGTLVSLDDQRRLKRVESLQELLNEEDASFCEHFRATRLTLPRHDDVLFPEDSSSDDDDDSSMDGDYQECLLLSHKTLRQHDDETLYLPRSTYSVDEALSCIPSVVAGAAAFLAAPVQCFGASSNERILYVGQAEVAHATPSQCDVMISDRATTCHVLMLRSTSSQKEPLVTCTHLDRPAYDDCLREMVATHVKYHDDAEPPALTIHVAGGMDDDTSRDLTHWLLHALADLAEQYNLPMRLETCVVSCLNDLNGRPQARGLCMRLADGAVARARCCDATVGGPHPTLRAVKLWCSMNHDTAPRLSLMHDHTRNEFCIAPFAFCAVESDDLDALLELPDEVLLCYTSTSPACEDDDFCQHVRATLQFLKTQTASHVFGSQLHSLRYGRVGATNQWKRL